MSNANDLIVKLEEAVDTLILKSSRLSSENFKKDNEIVELKQEVVALQQENTSLKNEVNALKVKSNKTDSNDVDLEKYKLKISEMVKEIDSCISLLNG